MISQLPAPQDIAGHYDEVMRELAGEYIHQRWGDSEIKRRHYRHTELALRHALEGVSRAGSLLEIGCGPAVWTPLFLEEPSRLTLLDISAGMLEGARRRIEGWEGGRHLSKVRFVCGDFVMEPAEPDAFDTIVSSRAFEYMSDKPLFVEKCFTALRPGGTLILVTKNRNWRDLRQTARTLERVAPNQIPIGVAMHLDVRSPEEVTAMMRERGFRAVSAYPAVVGSYHRPFSSRAGLGACDFLHRRFHRRPIAGWLQPLIESFLVIARKPV